MAREIGLGAHLALGTGERRSGARERASILADATEAVIGAVHEDGGIEAARALIMRLFRDRLENLAEPAPKDPKSLLQERLQAQGHELPEYRTVDVSGEHHQRVFNVACELRDLDVAVTATGRNRKEAEKRAAALMIGRVRAPWPLRPPGIRVHRAGRDRAHRNDAGMWRSWAVRTSASRRCSTWC